MTKLFATLCCSAFCAFSAAAALPADADVWNPDLGDGTYKNPIIHADYSDPDVIRVGNDYWMVASSFTHMPGIPILHSNDLIHWEIVNHVYPSFPSKKFDRPAHGEGTWAPAIRFHNGTYYVYFCTPDEGLYVARAKDPRGKWELHHMLDVAKWEDPCPFWDEDGKAYLVHSILRGGPVVVHRMSDDGMRLLDDGVTVYMDTKKNPVLEGMKIDKYNGWYYVLAPAGGVSKGWQTALRSRSIYGPYEARKILADCGNGINGPHQGGLVDTPTGEWWFLHFQSKGIHGRIINLEPAGWDKDGWLTLGVDENKDGVGEPVLTYRKPNVGKEYEPKLPQMSDEFSSKKLGLQWQWDANPRPEWLDLKSRKGFARLSAQICPSEKGNLYFAGNLLLQKLPAPEFTATTCVEEKLGAVGERAGLTMFGNEYSYIALVKGENSNSIAVLEGRNDKYAVVPQVRAEVPCAASKVWLRVHLNPADDTCSYSYSLDGTTFTPLGPACAVKPGTWVGAKVGIFCINPGVVPTKGYADFDWFRLTK